MTKNSKEALELAKKLSAVVNAEDKSADTTLHAVTSLLCALVSLILGEPHASRLYTSLNNMVYEANLRRTAN
jgi:hypothetical protein